MPNDHRAMRVRMPSMGRGLLTCATTLIVFAAIWQAALAQAPPSGVFAEVQSAVVPRASLALEPATLRSRVVQVDTQKITAARRGREVLKLNLFDDAVVEVQIKRVRPTSSGYFISGAPKGMDWGAVRLVVNGPVIVGTAITQEGKFTIRSAGSGRHVVRQIDPLKESLECEVQDAALAGPSSLPAIASIDHPPGGAASPPAVYADDTPTEDGTEVRVLVVYTPSLQAEQGGAAGIRALVDLLIESANLAYEESGINPRLVLAHASMVDYAETGDGTDLRNLIGPDDGYMDEVHVLRNKYAADLVHLLTVFSADAAGSAVRLRRESLVSENVSAFAVTTNASEETFTHEIGHNFGLRHDRYVNSPLGAIYPYAFGYINKRVFEPDAPRTARWRTIMAYGNRCSDAGFGCSRILRFSNPDQSHMGDPLGVPADSPATGADGPADARLTMNNTARWVGSYRSEACVDFAVSPEMPIAGAAGGEVVLQVDASPGCLWEASSQSEFLTVTSHARHAASGFARFDVAANEGGAERIGNLTIAGKNITVRQLATTAGACGRTPAVMRAITKAAGFEEAAQCDEVTDELLAGIRELHLIDLGIASLKEGDFVGLSGLVNLRADGNQFSEFPAGLFAGLANLQVLILEQNRLSELPTGLFAGLPDLETLNLARNQLTQIPANLISDLSSLQRLYLDYNRIAEPPESLLRGSTSLQHVDLEGNAIAGLPSGLFADLVNLQRLNLQSNDLTELPEGIFADLQSLEFLNLGFNKLTEFPEGVFANLSKLRELKLNSNRLAAFPAGVLAGLTNLQNLALGSNDLTELPQGLFDHLPLLEELRLAGNNLVVLPPGLLAGRSMLEILDLSSNRLVALPAGSFAGLSSLEGLWLNRNRLRDLPPAIFSELTSLGQLDLRTNELTQLPDGVFAGVGPLEALHLGRNLVDPLALQVSAEKMGEGRFKVVVPAAAPFSLELPVNISSGGSIEDGAGVVTISKGSTDSVVLQVTRDPESREPVTVDIGTLPNLPANHSGYMLTKDEALPLRILPSILPTDAMLIEIWLSEGELAPAFSTDTNQYTVVVANSVIRLTVNATKSNAGAAIAFLGSSDAALVDVDPIAEGHQVNLLVGENTLKVKVTSEDETTTQTYEVVVTRDRAADGCVRSEKVREAILAKVSGINACDDLTMEHLSSIRTLDLSHQGFSSLMERDFAGLVSLERLDLNNNELRSIPSGAFSDLKELKWLFLSDNRLSELPIDAFAGLTALDTLRLRENLLADLPSGIFAGLASLRQLGLRGNRLGSLPADVFADLTLLEDLGLSNNQLIDLPAGIFSDLPKLQVLALYENSLRTLRVDMFSGLAGLPDLYLGQNDLAELPPGLFAGMPALETLSLGGNNLASFPDGIFAPLTQLQYLGLHDNQLAKLQPDLFEGLESLESLILWDNGIVNLPADLFSPLTSLRRLFLNLNRLKQLPPGVFSGLTMLDELDLSANAVTPLPLAVSLEKAGNNQFQAVAPTGAPFDLELTFSVNNSGSIEGSANTLTIPAGALESTPLGVMRVAGTEEAVTVDIRELPELPETHEGYFLQADETLPRVIIPGPKASPPAQVTSVAVTAGVEQLEVTWSEETHAGGYKVQWKSGDEEYNEARQVVLAGGDTTSYTITGLTAGTEHTVRVNATKENADDGPPSSEVTGTPSALPASQVTGVEVARGVEQLDVSWDALSDANGYKVQWKSGDEEYDESRQAVVSGGETANYTITGLTAGTEYTIRVIATQENTDDGTPSSEVAGIPKAFPPSQVTGVEVTVGVGQLAFIWTANADAGGYKLQWKFGAEDYGEERQAVLIGGETISYTLTGLTAGTQYTVRVLSTKEHADDGTPSEEVTGIPNALRPAQVTGVEVTPGVEQLEVLWAEVSNADGYKVQWKSGGGDYDDLHQTAITGGDTVSHTITGLIASTEYTVRVIATSEHAEDGSPSSEVTGTPKAQPPAQVTGIEVEPGFDQLEMTWTAVSDADGYKVQWKSGAEAYSSARQAVLTGSDTVSHTITGLIADTEYTIRVIATKDNADDGPPSDEVTATPISANPDVNGDGVLNGDDALAMYHSYASADQLGDGETGGTPESRQSLLAGYSGKISPTDDDLKAMIRKANAWKDAGVDAGGDINEDGVVDESDAFVMYYAYTTANLVGDGETGGTARFRQLLLAAFTNKDNPTDEDLKKMLRRANKLRGDFA